MGIWQLVVFEICTKVIRGTIYLGTYAKVYTRRSLFAQSLSMSHPSGFGIRQVLLIRAGGLPIWSTFTVHSNLKSEKSVNFGDC